MLAILDFLKSYISAVWRAIELKFETWAYYPQYIIGTYFEIKLSTCSFAPFAIGEGSKSPKKGSPALCQG